MKAIGFTQHLPITDEHSLENITLPTPTPEGHDLLINVHAVSVNPCLLYTSDAADEL